VDNITLTGRTLEPKIPQLTSQGPLMLKQRCTAIQSSETLSATSNILVESRVWPPGLQLHRRL
jgi:hypothetical protein